MKHIKLYESFLGEAKKTGLVTSFNKPYKGTGKIVGLGQVHFDVDDLAKVVVKYLGGTLAEAKKNIMAAADDDSLEPLMDDYMDAYDDDSDSDTTANASVDLTDAFVELVTSNYDDIEDDDTLDEFNDAVRDQRLWGEPSYGLQK